MFNIPALTWTLTAVLLAGGSYHLRQAARSRHLTDRANNTLHALMNALMAAMLWNLAPSTTLAQIGLLTAAALWFVIQAVARPEFKTLCGGSQGRLKCAYHSLTMAGAALMVAMMAGHATTTAGHGTDPAAGMTMTNTHHPIPAPTHNTAAATLHHPPDLAIPLTAIFGAAALVFLILLLRSRGTKPTRHHPTAPGLSARTEHALEALGAAAMALMFATMSA